MRDVCKLAFADKAAGAVMEYGHDYPCRLTVGLSYRNPRTHDKPMTAALLAEYMRERGRSYWWDVTEDGGTLYACAYSADDMW